MNRIVLTAVAVLLAVFLSLPSAGEGPISLSSSKEGNASGMVRGTGPLEEIARTVLRIESKSPGVEIPFEICYVDDTQDPEKNP